MALICLGSVSAAPGVTTLSVLMAASWPRPAVLIEADPSGGVLAVRYRLGRSPGLSQLAALVRQGAPPEVVWAHSQMLPGDLPVVVAPESGPVTTNILRDASHELARWCGYHQNADLIVDCGRLAVEDVTWPLWAAADEMLLVTRPRADELYPVAHRFRAMENHVRSHGIVLVGDRPYRPEEIATQLRLPIRGTVADDARAAGVLARGGSGRTLRRSALVRSVRSLVDNLALRLGLPVVSPNNASLPVAEPDRQRRRRRGRGAGAQGAQGRSPTPPSRLEGGPLPRPGEAQPPPGPAQPDWQPAAPAAPTGPGEGAEPPFTPMPPPPPGPAGREGSEGAVPLGPAGPAGPAPEQEERPQPPPPPEPPEPPSRPETGQTGPEAPPSSSPSSPDDSPGPESPDDPGGTRRSDGQPQPKQPTPGGEMRDRSGFEPPPPPRIPPPPSIPPPPPAYRPKRSRRVGEVAAAAAASTRDDAPEPLAPIAPPAPEAQSSEADAGDDHDELSSAIQAAEALGSKIEELSELAREDVADGQVDGGNEASRTPRGPGNDYGDAMDGSDGDSQTQGAVTTQRPAGGPATLPLDELERTAAMLADGAHAFQSPDAEAGEPGSEGSKDGDGKTRKPVTGVNRTIEAPGGKIIINLPPLERRNGSKPAKAARSAAAPGGADPAEPAEPIEPAPAGQSGPAPAGQSQRAEQAQQGEKPHGNAGEQAQENETEQTANPGPDGDAHLEPTPAASAAAAGGAASGRPTTAPPGPGAAGTAEAGGQTVVNARATATADEVSTSQGAARTTGEGNVARTRSER